MALFYVTADHSGGADVGHSCRHGSYSDPADVFWEEVEADDEEAAYDAGMGMLSDLVDEAEPCRCHRHKQPGGERWWSSVSVVVLPADVAAYKICRKAGMGKHEAASYMRGHAFVFAADDPCLWLDALGLNQTTPFSVGADLAEERGMARAMRVLRRAASKQANR